MSINKRYVPELPKLKELLLEQGSAYFYMIYSKPDVLIGSLESIEFIEEFTKEYLD